MKKEAETSTLRKNSMKGPGNISTTNDFCESQILSTFKCCDSTIYSKPPFVTIMLIGIQTKKSQIHTLTVIPVHSYKWCLVCHGEDMHVFCIQMKMDL